MRTAEGASPTVSSGNTLFTLLGFIGLYLLLGMLFLLLVGKIINKGPHNVELNRKNIIMEFFWYVVLMGILAVYIVLDGYDFGAGIIHLFFAKDRER